MKRLPLLPLFLLTLLLAGCAGGAAPTEDPIPSATRPDTVPTVPATEFTEVTEATTLPPDPIRTLLDSMTLRQKVGQLFLVRPGALDTALTAQMEDSHTALTADMAAMLAEYPVGGICFFAKNLESPTQTAEFLRAFQEASAIPLFLAIDEEGGTVSRIANHSGFDVPRYSSAAAVGRSGEYADALDMGRTVGAYLAQLGFNLDFAPVADVNTNPRNPVIGKRAFSSQPEVAARMAGGMADGLRGQGVIATFKHFPGHGDTTEDSHLDLAVSYRTLEELRGSELLPFAQATALDMVMVGHIALPNVTGDMTPATLSRTLVTELLKEEMGFSGLVITDGMEMAAITRLHSAGEAAILALEAGCDLILLPESLPEAFEAVLEAVTQGRLSLQWLDETVGRILAFKEAHGILDLS